MLFRSLPIDRAVYPRSKSLEVVFLYSVILYSYCKRIDAWCVCVCVCNGDKAADVNIMCFVCVSK